MSIHDYKIRIDKAVRDNDGAPLYNGSIEHASALAEAIFANANSHVCILTGSLNARVYGPDEVVEQAKLFLANPDHKMRILLENGSDANKDGHPFFEELSDHDNVKFRNVPDDVQETYEFHFMTMDGASYRFEEDKTECSAIAAFGHPDGAKNLEVVFDDLWKLSS